MRFVSTLYREAKAEVSAWLVWKLFYSPGRKS
jgi:hypothetical protein